MASLGKVMASLGKVMASLGKVVVGVGKVRLQADRFVVVDDSLLVPAKPVVG